jgi:CMP-N-acetylneuraminic acid synthetase
LARGGSKGIPGKNIKKLNGKPLIAYTIEAAQKSKYINKIVVSTDDKDIAKVALNFGAEVPFMRPDELATEDANSNDAIIHALKFLSSNQDYKSDYIINLQPTSPLRGVKDIDEAIETFFRYDNYYESLISVCEVFENPYWMQKIENGILTSLMDNFENINRRQELPTVYQLNGAIYLSTYKKFLEYKSFYTEKIYPFVMNKEKSIDIDNELDWKLAKILLEEKK